MRFIVLCKTCKSYLVNREGICVYIVRIGLFCLKLSKRRLRVTKLKVSGLGCGDIGLKLLQKV